MNRIGSKGDVISANVRTKSFHGGKIAWVILMGMTLSGASGATSALAQRYEFLPSSMSP